MGTNPLGQYSQLVAVIVVIGTIAAWIFAVLVGKADAASQINPFAILAFGAVLGSAATVNGYKREQVATNKRLDALGAPAAAAADPAPAPAAK